MECEKFKPLLMGLIDGELTPEETAEVNSHLIKCDACRNEFEELKDTAGQIDTVSFIEPQDEVLRKLWKSPYSRLIRNSGLLLVFSGWLFLILFALFEIIRSPDEPFLPKIAVAAMIIGFLVLLVFLIRERIHTYKVDPYKEVKR
jgi:hypothetical protein